MRGDDADRARRDRRRARRRLELFHHAPDLVVDEALARGLERALAPIDLGEAQRRDEDFVERPRGAVHARMALDHLCRVLGVERQQPLVEALPRRQHRVGTEKHVEVAELGNVPADHRHANR